MPVGDIIETAFVAYGHSQNVINVMHWRLQTITGTEPTPVEKANSISGTWATNIKTVLSAQFSYKGVKYRLLSPTPTAIIVSTQGNGAGSIAGDPLPPQLSAVLSLRSSSAPPRVRGRMYMPPTSETHNSNVGELEAAYVTLLGTFRAAMITTQTLTGAGGSCTVSPVIWRKPPVGTFYVIDSVLVRTAWGTQRRRSSINRGDTPAV